MSRPVRVLFICLHGAAKSVIAREHFRRLARAEGLGVEAMSAGVEPDDLIPPHVVLGLAADGIDVPERIPHGLADADLAHADLVVSFACDVQTGPGSPTLVRWDDVPAVSDGYGPARDAIIARLRTLLAGELRA